MLSVKYVLSDIGKSFLFPFFRQHGEKAFQKSFCFRMNRRILSALQVVNERILLSIIGTIISFAGCNSVHQHFNHIFLRHFCRSHTSLYFLCTVIDPIFVMMLITPLVMKPCTGIADCLSFGIVGASVSLIIFCTHHKFCWAEF